jgi:hypothetical protein
MAEVVHPCPCRGDAVEGLGLFLWRRRFALVVKGPYADEFLQKFTCDCYLPSDVLLDHFDRFMTSADAHLKVSGIMSIPIENLYTVMSPLILAGGNVHGRVYIGLSYLCYLAALYADNRANMRILAFTSRMFLSRCVSNQVAAFGGWDAYILGVRREPTLWRKLCLFFRLI